MIVSSRSAVLLLVALPYAATASTVVSETSYTPYPGLTIVERVESGPSNRIKVAYVDLCHDGVEIQARDSFSTRRTPGSWGAAVDAELATNGDFYRTDTSIPTVYGDAVGFGNRWPVSRRGAGYASAWYYPKYGWIGFGGDYVEFSHSEWIKEHPGQFPVEEGWSPDAVDLDLPGNIDALVSGFPELVVEGTRVTCSSPTASTCFPDRSDMRARHPRTAMGLTEDRQTFILAVVDGRSGVSAGMYGTELAALMDDLGAWVAFNLDGGGSSAMWLSGDGYLNSPSDGSARAVANHWGVQANGSGDPASCFKWGGCYPYPVPGAENQVFQDMPPGSFAWEEAQILLDHGIVDGCQGPPDRMFCPNCGLSRAAMAKVLANAAGLDTSNPPANPTFDDVPTSHWAYAAIEAIAAAGITLGCGGNNYCPNDDVTRGQMAAFITRAQGWPNPNPPSPTFDDVPSGHLFFQSIESLVEHCVTTGCGGDDYCPDRGITRAETAVFVARAWDLDDINPCIGDTDTDTDVDTDSDTDTDTDGDTDTDTGWSDTGWTLESSLVDAERDPWDDLPPVDVTVEYPCGCDAGSTGAGAWMIVMALAWRRRRV